MFRFIRKSVYANIAIRLSAFTRYATHTSYRGHCDEHDVLFDLLDSKNKSKFGSASDLRETGTDSERRCIILNGLLNSSIDIQADFDAIKQKVRRGDRLVAILYNPYMRLLFQVLDKMGLRKGPPASTFVTETDLENLCKLSGWHFVRHKWVALFPFRLFGLGSALDNLLTLIPLLRSFSTTYIAVLRPIIAVPGQQRTKLSVVIPARNERGNIEAAILRMPKIDHTDIEVIFVEGHSKDQTMEEILRVSNVYKTTHDIKTFQQTGKGKADAVRLGFSKASGDLLTILDADLTMPPELLGRFVVAYRNGDADFINGSRLLYPMEGEAMRFLNHLGNIFFAKALSYVLSTKLGDSLCGTKMMSKVDYQRMTDWRKDFGDFDPFGDFEMIFPAAVLALGTIDVPIRYRNRVYGETNISRWSHGLMLAKMTTIGFFKIKLLRG